MAKNTGGVFGFEYLEDAELEQSDVVGCVSTIRRPGGPIVCDVPRFPEVPSLPPIGIPGSPTGPMMP